VEEFVDLLFVKCVCGNLVGIAKNSPDATVECMCGRKICVPSPGESPPTPNVHELLTTLSKPGRAFSNPSMTAAGEELDRDSQLFAYATVQYQRGFSASQIENQLVEQGIDRDRARSVARAAVEASKGVVREAGLRNMAIGGTVCAAGLAVTFFSYWRAVAHPGTGTFLLAWGAILFGAMQFLYGLGQAVFGSN
jgi:hypothetical protein